MNESEKKMISLDFKFLDTTYELVVIGIYYPEEKGTETSPPDGDFLEDTYIYLADDYNLSSDPTDLFELLNPKIVDLIIEETINIIRREEW